MAGYEGWKNFATWRLYNILHYGEYRLMIGGWLDQWAEQGYSKSDAAESLYGEITALVQSDYEATLANSSWLVQDLMLKDPAEMDIDWDAIVDRFMEDYAVKKSSRSDNRKTRTAKKPIQRRR